MALGESGWGRKRRDAILDRRSDQLIRIVVSGIDARETTVNRDKRQSENFDIDVGSRVWKNTRKYVTKLLETNSLVSYTLRNCFIQTYL